MSTALLIDAENIAAKYAQYIIHYASNYPNLIYKRLYADFTNGNLNSWKNASIIHKLEPIQIFHLIKGKNAADIALCIDAMELAICTDVDTFIIASSDSDISAIINKLYRYNKKVILMGMEKTHETLISACTHFVNLASLEEKAKEETDQIQTKTIVVQDTQEKKQEIKNKTKQETKQANTTKATNKETIKADLTFDQNNATKNIPSKTQLKIFITKYLKAIPTNKTSPNILQKALTNKYINYNHKSYGYKKFSDLIKELGYNFKDNLISLNNK